LPQRRNKYNKKYHKERFRINNRGRKKLLKTINSLLSNPTRRNRLLH
jgi:hypothetical protein